MMTGIATSLKLLMEVYDLWIEMGYTASKDMNIGPSLKYPIKPFYVKAMELLYYVGIVLKFMIEISVQSVRLRNSFLSSSTLIKEIVISISTYLIF